MNYVFCKIKFLSNDVDMVSHYSIELHQEAVVVTFVLDVINGPYLLIFVLSINNC